jgi:WhiB family redox-sensing transcriptional regulator
VVAWVQLDLRTDDEADWFAGDPGDLHSLDALVAWLAARPRWQSDAACRDHPELTWFPERGDDTRPAKTVCASCPVRDDCATFAASFGGTLVGVWAGSSGRERRRHHYPVA